MPPKELERTQLIPSATVNVSFGGPFAEEKKDEDKDKDRTYRLWILLIILLCCLVVGVTVPVAVYLSTNTNASPSPPGTSAWNPEYCCINFDDGSPATSPASSEVPSAQCLGDAGTVQYYGIPVTCGMIASNESCGTDPSQASCLACGCGPVAIGPSNPPATRRKLSVSDVDALKAALVSALANVSLAQIDIQTLTNGSLVCIEALNDMHADYLLGMANATDLLEALKAALSNSALTIENAYLTEEALVVSPPPPPPLPALPPPSTPPSGPMTFTPVTLPMPYQYSQTMHDPGIIGQCNPHLLMYHHPDLGQYLNASGGDWLSSIDGIPSPYHLAFATFKGGNLVEHAAFCARRCKDINEGANNFTGGWNLYDGCRVENGGDGTRDKVLHPTSKKCTSVFILNADVSAYPSGFFLQNYVQCIFLAITDEESPLTANFNSVYGGPFVAPIFIMSMKKLTGTPQNTTALTDCMASVANAAAMPYTKAGNRSDHVGGGYNMLSYDHSSVDTNQVYPIAYLLAIPYSLVADDNAHVDYCFQRCKDINAGTNGFTGGWSSTNADGTIGSATSDKCCAFETEVRNNPPPISYRNCYFYSSANVGSMTAWLEPTISSVYYNTYSMVPFPTMTNERRLAERP